jgi:hypothetical protein
MPSSHFIRSHVTHAGETEPCENDKEKKEGGDNKGDKKQNRRVTEINTDNRQHLNLISENKR